MFNSPLGEFFQKAAIRDFGDGIDDRKFMVACFKLRNSEVEAALPRERLLVYDVSEGWEPLCSFLDVPVPDRPYPRANVRDDLASIISAVAEGGDEAFVANLRSGVSNQLRSAEEKS